MVLPVVEDMVVLLLVLVVVVVACEVVCIAENRYRHRRKTFPMNTLGEEG